MESLGICVVYYLQVTLNKRPHEWLYVGNAVSKERNRMKIAMWLLLRPSGGNPQHCSTFGIIFQVNHGQQMPTMVVMTAEVVKKTTTTSTWRIGC